MSDSPLNFLESPLKCAWRHIGRQTARRAAPRLDNKHSWQSLAGQQQRCFGTCSCSPSSDKTSTRGCHNLRMRTGSSWPVSSLPGYCELRNGSLSWTPTVVPASGPFRRVQCQRRSLYYLPLVKASGYTYFARRIWGSGGGAALLPLS